MLETKKVIIINKKLVRITLFNGLLHYVPTYNFDDEI